METPAAVAATWEGWINVGQGLDDEGWRAQTRCPGWDVAAIYAHVSTFPAGLAAGAVHPLADPGPTPLLSAADILRGFNQPGGVAETMAGVVADAAAREGATQDREAVIARFRTGQEALVELREADLAAAIPWPGTPSPTTLAEGLRIVLLESVVHLLDVMRALDLPPQLPGPALREAGRLLAELAPPVEFIEAATGRSPTSPFPVLR